MSEIPAKQAREIMESNAEVDLWYSKFKDELFESIKNTALKGNNSTSINSDLWGRSELKKEYLVKRLVSLGYLVKIEKVMTISW
jgi:ketopantoate reductase